MRIQNTTGSEKKTSGNLPLSFEELLFLSIDSDLVPLLDLIEFKSNKTKYCFSSDKDLAKLLKQSISSIKKKLKRLADLGAIFRERISRNKKGGSRRIIFTNKNYQNRDQILAAFPPNKIIGVRNSLNYSHPDSLNYIHPDAQKYLSSASRISDPIYYGNNASISTIKTPSNSTSLSTSLPSAINRANHVYDKKVVNKAMLQKPQKTTPSSKRNIDKETISIEDRKLFVENYGHEAVQKSEANALKYMILAAEDNNANGPYYQRGLTENTRKYLEEDRKKLVERRAKAEKKKEVKKPSCEDFVQIRKKNLKNDQFLAKYVNVDANGFFIRYDRLTNEEYNSLSKTGLAFDDSLEQEERSYDMALSTLKREMSSIIRKREREST